MQRAILCLTTALALGPGLARADIFDEADITITEYPVGGTDLVEIQDDMNRNGPNGFWAYTTWNVNWTAECETSVTADIIMPVLGDDADLYDEEVAEFERMAEALLDHELGHVQIGLDFAADIEAQDCPAEYADIHQYWLQVERDYDAETRHGADQGVSLGTP